MSRIRWRGGVSRKWSEIWPFDPSNVPFDSGDLDDLLDDLPDDFVLENEDLPDVSMTSAWDRRIYYARVQKFAGKVRCCPRGVVRVVGILHVATRIWQRFVEGPRRTTRYSRSNWRTMGWDRGKSSNKTASPSISSRKATDDKAHGIAKLPVCGGTWYSCMYCGDGKSHWRVESWEELKLVLEKTYKRRQKKRKVAPSQLVKKRKAVSSQSVNSSKRRRREEWRED